MKIKIITIPKVSGTTSCAVQLQEAHSHHNPYKWCCASRDAFHIKHHVSGAPGAVQSGREKALLISPSEAYYTHLIVPQAYCNLIFPAQKNAVTCLYLASLPSQLFPF